MGLLVMAFTVNAIISTLCIWLATKFSFVQADIKTIAVIVICVSVVSIIPTIGWLLGIAVFFYLLIKATGCSIVDAMWVVLFTQLFSFCIFFAISMAGGI